jgi:hypothetical protein
MTTLAPVRKCLPDRRCPIPQPEEVDLRCDYRYTIRQEKTDRYAKTTEKDHAYHTVALGP